MDTPPRPCLLDVATFHSSLKAQLKYFFHCEAYLKFPGQINDSLLHTYLVFWASGQYYTYYITTSYLPV